MRFDQTIRNSCEFKRQHMPGSDCKRIKHGILSFSRSRSFLYSISAQTNGVDNHPSVHEGASEKERASQCHLPPFFSLTFQNFLISANSNRLLPRQILRIKETESSLSLLELVHTYSSYQVQIRCISSSRVS